MGLFPKDRDLTRAPEDVRLRVDASAMQLRADQVHVRLDHFLTGHLKWRSRTSIQELIREGQVLVDASTPDHPRGSGQPAVERRPGRKMHHGSLVVVVIPEELRLPMQGASSGEVDVLYEDAGVLVVDKPPLMTVHPSGRHMTDTLIQRVHARFADAIRAGEMVPRLCHRLDRETSGVLLIGKLSGAHRELMKQFEQREVEKEYLAVVHGEIEQDSGLIDFPLAPSRVSRIGLKMAVCVDGQVALTAFEVVRRYAGYTLVRCDLHTGRQHQIRVHLAAIGHALVGDKLYGMDEELFQRDLEGTLDASDRARLELPRHALHHHRLAFTSPSTGKRVEVISPLAPDLEEFLSSIPPAS